MVAYTCSAAKEDLETCFPSSRVDFAIACLSMLSTLWMLYLPFGCVLFVVRLCSVLVAGLYSKHRSRDEYVNVFASNDYSWINGLRSEVKAVCTVHGVRC